MVPRQRLESMCLMKWRASPAPHRGQGRADACENLQPPLMNTELTRPSDCHITGWAPFIISPPHLCEPRVVLPLTGHMFVPAGARNDRTQTNHSVFFSHDRKILSVPSDMCRLCIRAPAHTAVVCLMLWKLILVGDVGMDMALATRRRRLWWSCQRCHRFLTTERTCSSEEASLHDKDRNLKKNVKNSTLSVPVE